jgi:hypothetical protein
MKQGVIQGLAAIAGRLEEYGQALLELFLADILMQSFGTQGKVAPHLLDGLLAGHKPPAGYIFLKIHPVVVFLLHVQDLIPDSGKGAQRLADQLLDLHPAHILGMEFLHLA